MKALITLIVCWLLTTVCGTAGVLNAGDDFIDAGGSSTFFDPLDNDAVLGLRSIDPLSFSIIDSPQHGRVMVESSSGGVAVGYIRSEPGADMARYEICLTDGTCDMATMWFLEGSVGPLVSSSADRLEPVNLATSSLSGDVYIFIPDLLPAGTVESIRFLLNDEPVGFERYPPYDLAGGTETWAAALNTARFEDLPLLVTTEIKFTAAAGGHLERIETQTLIANTPLLAFSYSKDRSSAGILEGGFFGGEVFVFLGILPLNFGIGPVPWSADGVANVRFFLDDILVRNERFAPYDLAGGNTEEAIPFNTSSLLPGQHQLRAVVILQNGEQITVASHFVVL